MIYDKKVSVVILAAGSGRRFGTDMNKVYVKLGGKEVLRYSLERFKENEYVDEIILIVKKDEKEIADKIIHEMNFIKSIQVVSGGKTRRDSVYNGICKVCGDIVLIHDAARPFLTDKMINDCLNAMSSYKACTIGVKTKDTIKITDDLNIVLKTTQRNNTWQIQTPQCFDRDELINISKANTSDITDECMMFEASGIEVKIIDGSYTNIKLTTRDDLVIMDAILKNILKLK